MQHDIDPEWNENRGESLDMNATPHTLRRWIIIIKMFYIDSEIDRISKLGHNRNRPNDGCDDVSYWILVNSWPLFPFMIFIGKKKKNFMLDMKLFHSIKKESNLLIKLITSSNNDRARKLGRKKVPWYHKVRFKAPC